ncbi:DUF4861 family protein [Flavobacterium artemisiae]|uniref:DUF4861 family protein n=1 Tax=Flavobacterium artemisiae TaxID=2126556 RepID=A0ABW4HID6_9FLAO
MKTKITTAVLFFAGLTAINAQKYDIKTNKTYAEISAKTDGKWEGRKYKGGTVFKNVDRLKLAPEHTDHSFDIRYEGPGWENNRIGYRLYLDWRNAIDIFGKKTSENILPKVGQDGFDSYHEMSDWGADILKAGKGIGIGSIDRYLNNEKLHFREVDSTIAVVSNKANESVVKVNYYGWKTASDNIDFVSELTIKPNNLYTQHTIKASKEIKGICTGIVKQKNTDLLKKESKNKKWAYLATYGEQSLVPDKLGMAIFYEISTIESTQDTDLDYLLVFKPTTKAVTFYLLGAWEQEVNGIKSKEEFEKYLNEKLEVLNKKGKM